MFDILKDREYREIIRGIYFGEKAIKTDRYFNRRAEMWDKIARWLEETPQPQLVEDDELFNELISVDKKYDNRGRLMLENKDEIKKKLGRSPDKADALALTFAEPIYDYGIPKLYNSGTISVEDIFKYQARRHSDW